MNSLESPQNIETSSPASPEDSSFGDVLRQFELEHQQQETSNAALEGTVLSVSVEAIMVDIGRKQEGVLIPGADGVPRDIAAGAKVLVNVTGRTEDGYYQLSTIRIEQPKDFTALQAAFDEKQVISGTVTEQVKGGLRVDVGVPAFLPASRSGVREVAELESLVGKQIQCRVTKLDVSNPDRPDVVVDRRGVLEEEAAKAKREAFEKLSEGMIVNATVRNVTDFGAFLEIMPGVDGLLHVADISWNRVDKPSSVMKPGDSLQVKILRINRETRKISLGLKQLTPDPWSQAAEQFKPGERVRGKVVRLTDFGAFVELLPGVDGLIHLSEMSWTKRVRKPSDILQSGETVEAVVLGVNPAEKRISLGLKQALGNPWDDIEKKFPVGAIVEGPVSSLAQFGAFVTLAEGIDGMVHIADIQRDKKLQHPKEVLNVGQVVRAQVTEVDKDKRRIRLSMKQLEPTAADLFIQEHQLGETLTARVAEVHRGEARVEVADGVTARCKLKETAPVEEPSAAAGGSIDDWTQLLKSRWKGGVGGSAGAGGAKGPAGDSKESVKPGGTYRFRITSMDAASRRIEVELAE